MKLNFDDKENILLAQRWILRGVGFSPGDDNIKKWQMSFAVASVINILFFLVFQFWNCFANINDMAEFLRGFSISVPQVFVAIKLLILIVKRKDFKRIIDFIVKAFAEGELFMRIMFQRLLILFTETNVEFRRINADASRKSFNLSRWSAFVGLCVFAIFVFVPMIVNAYKTFAGDELDYRMPVEAK